MDEISETGDDAGPAADDNVITLPAADEAEPPHPFKMKDLLDAIAPQSELKRSELRDAAGLILATLGEALDREQSVNLPGLGKIEIRRREAKPSGDHLVARIKLADRTASGTGKDVEEDAGESSED